MSTFSLLADESANNSSALDEISAIGGTVEESFEDSLGDVSPITLRKDLIQESYFEDSPSASREPLSHRVFEQSDSEESESEEERQTESPYISENQADSSEEEVTSKKAVVPIKQSHLHHLEALQQGDSFPGLKKTKTRKRTVIESDSEDEPNLDADVLNQTNISTYRSGKAIPSDSEDDSGSESSSDGEDARAQKSAHQNRIESEDEVDEFDSDKENGPQIVDDSPKTTSMVPSKVTDKPLVVSLEDEWTENGEQIQNISDSISEVDQIDHSASPDVLSHRIQDLSIEEIPSSPETRTADPREIHQVRRSLEQKQTLLRTIRLNTLPDGGAKIKSQIKELESQLAFMEKNGSSNQTKPTSTIPKPTESAARQSREEELRKSVQMKKWALGNATGAQRDRLRSEIASMEKEIFSLVMANGNVTNTYKPLAMNGAKEPAIKLLPEAPTLSDMQRRMFAEQPTDQQLYLKGERQTAAQKREAVSVTLDALQNLHQSLATCPSEKETEPTPNALTVPLLPHQNRSLKWLMWRETQNPAGGILADDMGLGKTLTMIALIVRQLELEPPTVADVWLSKTLKIKKSSGTLIVCPASVIGQWDNEIQRRCKRNALKVMTFHGPDRHKVASKLHQFDVVLTTYQIITREVSTLSVDKNSDMPIGDFNEETQGKEIRQSALLQIAWERIILDEAHTIRNPKSQVSQAVCRLRAARRWAVTGTPVQNKELDMYSLLRFLRVSPFDQLQVWKRWVDSSKTEQAAGRLQLLIKTLLLRRTKDQKCENSEKPIVSMPAREMHTHQITLTQEENEVYQKILDFSRKALEQYIKSQERKMRDEYAYQQEKESRPQKSMTKQHLLVLLLRLRQACSHPALIKTMLDTAETETLGSEAKIEEGGDLDLISQMASMTIGGTGSAEKKEEEEKNFFTLSNPVFDMNNKSSKLKTVVDEVKRVTDLKQKVVVVSQWTSMLDVFALHFKKLRIQCHTIAGNVPVKQRTAIVEDFNTNPKGPPVMLLSLAAGGVGLNLIGGNHLFLTDMHWNPQLEAQACDRVYRVGQVRDVHVHRLVTVGTVEERIVELQKQKLAMANGILTGAANITTKGLTLEDLKMLFNPSPSVAFPTKSLDI